MFWHVLKLKKSNFVMALSFFTPLLLLLLFLTTAPPHKNSYLYSIGISSALALFYARRLFTFLYFDFSPLRSFVRPDFGSFAGASTTYCTKCSSPQAQNMLMVVSFLYPTFDVHPYTNSNHTTQRKFRPKEHKSLFRMTSVHPQIECYY
jgi:hypothetical protein